MFPFQCRTQCLRVYRDQNQIVFVRVIAPQGFRQLRGGGEMQEAVGPVMRRAVIVAAALLPIPRAARS